MTTTNINQLPFALPKYGNAQQQNAFFTQSAGQFLIPMRSFAYSVVEAFGGVVVAAHTRPHNAEFKVVHGAHFMQIMKGMGIKITHMLEVKGGFKCFTQFNGPSACFIQKRIVNGQEQYTAVLAMRHVAHELFRGAFPQGVAPQQNKFIADAIAQAYIDDTEVIKPEGFGGAGESIPDEHLAYLRDMEANAPAPEEVLPEAPAVAQGQLPFPEVIVTANDLPLGL